MKTTCQAWRRVDCYWPIKVFATGVRIRWLGRLAYIPLPEDYIAVEDHDDWVWRKVLGPFYWRVR